MRTKVTLITGANGEIGQALITQLAETGREALLGLDIRPLPPELAARCHTSLVGDIMDERLLERLVSEFEIGQIFHLAALLSTRSEFTPEAAHKVNVGGTLNLLHLAIEQSRWRGDPVKFLFPSSVAVYGLPDLETKLRAGAVKEHEWNRPQTMYGCNKLYCEHLGRYYARHYRQLAQDPEPYGVDFRSIRFPGLISATTVPSGGTSDYAPEMLHHAARREPYSCFVRPDTQIPFLAMPDAVTALLALAAAPQERLTQLVYNVTSFSLTAEQVRDLVLRHFPQASIQFAPDGRRQKIVDSWPEAVDDERARTDWGWRPAYDLAGAFSAYLIPTISQRYHQ